MSAVTPLFPAFVPLSLAWMAIAIISLSVGSFLTVVVTRVPGLVDARDRGVPWRAVPNLLGPGSRCDHCATPLAPVDNVPLLGFLLQGGRCRHCGKPIGWSNLGLELAAASVGVIVFLSYGLTVCGLAAALLAWLLLGLAALDFQERLLPDALVQPILWGGLLMRHWEIWPGSTGDAVVSSAAAYLVMRLAGEGACWWFSRRGEPWSLDHALGGGDLSLFAAIAVWTGFVQAFAVLLLAIPFALVWLLVRAANKKEATGVPLGGPLAAAMICWLIGQALAN